jgi:hypothetical protein
MNILVQPYGTAYWICRPDTTWEKDNEDFFPPECISALSFTPILFAKISKPGKVIGEKFASRYFDSINYGILLYPENIASDGQLGFSQANCVDHTSFLPSPMYNKITLGQGNEFILNKNDKEIFRYSEGNLSMIDKAVSQASALTYLRVGDMVSIELSKPQHLMDRSDGNVKISGSYCDNWLLEFKIIV